MCMRLTLALVIISGLFGASTAHADRGVGINVSGIAVTDTLAQGGGYNLPGFAVINTGDEPAEYEVTVSSVANQPQRRPDASWFEFQPRRFTLEPGKVQNVQTRLVLPSGADTGDYFGQIQAQVVTEGTGNTVGIAAAARLSFTVEPSSWFAAQRLRFARFLRDMEPWTYVVEGALIAGLAGYLIVRYSPVKVVRRE